MLEPSAYSYPLVIVHSAIPFSSAENKQPGEAVPEAATAARVITETIEKDLRWCLRLANQLGPLEIRTWTGFAAGQEMGAEFKRVLDEAHVIVVLVSAELLATNRCREIFERLKRPHRKALTVRPILVRSCIYDGEPLLDEVPPINAQPLESMRGYEQERYLAEAARRITDNLRWAFRQEVSYILGQRPADVREHLERVMTVLSQAGPRLGGVLCSIQDVGAYLLQEGLGCGTTASPWKDALTGVRIAEIIRRLTHICRRAPSTSEARSYDEICTVIRCLRALAPDLKADADDPDPLPRAPDVPLLLLPLWITAAGSSSLDESRWKAASAESLAKLPSYFKAQYSAPAEQTKQRPMPLIRILHSIWFCMLLLKESESGSVSLTPRERDALSYVLREDLRFLCFGFEDNEEQRGVRRSARAGRHSRLAVGWAHA